MGISAAQVRQMTDTLEGLMGDEAVVKTHAGESGYGAVYAAPVSIPCRLIEVRRLVTADGQIATTELTLDVLPENVASFTIGSKVSCLGWDAIVRVVKPTRYGARMVYAKVSCA